MRPFNNKKKTRRTDLRRVAIPARPSLWRRFRDAGGPIAVLIALMFYVGVLMLDLWPADPFPYRTGQYISMDILSRVDFSIPSHKRTEDERARKVSETPATFQLDKLLHEKIVTTLKSVPGMLASATQPADADETLLKRMNISSADDLDVWRKYAQQPQQAKYHEQIDKLATDMLSVAFVHAEEQDAQFSRNATKVRLAHGLAPKSSLVSIRDSAQLEYRISRLVNVLDAPIRPYVREYLVNVFRTQSQPLYKYDSTTSQNDIEQAIAAVMANPPRDIYQKDRVIVSRSSDKNRLTEDDIRILAAEHEQYLAAENSNGWRSWGRHLGRAGIILLVVVLMCAYVYKYRQDMVQFPLRAISVALTLLIMLALNKIMIQVFQLSMYSTTLPVLTGAFVLAIAYDQRFALAMSGALALLAVLQMRQGMDMLLVHAAGIAAAVAMLGEIRTRSKLVLVSAAAAGASMLTVWAVGLSMGIPWWPFVLVSSGWAVLFALLAGFFVQGILPLIERAFRVATSMTLLEWADANKPLLRRLAVEAPGTYNHSLQLGAMCEAAADAIGARGLLARVGAYYHDIGKINKPDYFIENQGASPSKHAKLSPAMSLLIITGHVKDGLELAREYNLPRVLHEFIISHHGTTLVQYFYHAATELRKAEAERAPDEVEFRYPGPKPRSPEAAILMLADAAESSVRTLQEPTPGRIENQVHAMVTRRLMDGQLDECELTLKQVHQIEDSLVKTLAAMYHARVPYPTPAGEKASAAELRASIETRHETTTESKDEKTKPQDQTTHKSEASESDTSGAKPQVTDKVEDAESDTSGAKPQVSDKVEDAESDTSGAKPQVTDKVEDAESDTSGAKPQVTDKVEDAESDTSGAKPQATDKVEDAESDTSGAKPQVSDKDEANGSTGQGEKPSSDKDA